jgi:hypothetical protein
MFNYTLSFRPYWIWRGLMTAFLTGSLVSSYLGNQPAQAETTTYCQQSSDAIAEKEKFRQATLNGDRDSQNAYKTILTKHGDALQLCRNKTWPQTQAIWLRLYPCDTKPGVIDKVLDDIVNRGYNQVYVETFYDSQVLLPAADNPTNWTSVVRTPGAEKTDLLAQAIQKGRDRGLKVYSWLFSLNFGYSYAQRPDRQSVLARNAQNQSSLDAVTDTELDIKGGANQSDKAFIDPYNLQARQDYSSLINAVLQRRPDGVLFDYIRFPRQIGGASVVSKVQDLWIYGEAAQQTLYQRALNSKGLELIRRFLKKGFVTVDDIATVDKLYPTEGEPLWQGRNPTLTASLVPAAQRQPQIQVELWQLSVAHAMQGVVDFLTQAVQPVQQQGITAGAVFFPDGNQVIRQGFDSRLQPWDRFPNSIEWHPMVYGICGNSSCIVSQLQRVLSYAPPGTKVIPALAGNWGQSVKNRPPLEVQMEDIHRIAPQVNAVSHFAYSWQEPEFDRDRQFCHLK